MKLFKKHLILLAALPLCLTSCGKDAAVALPNGGKVMQDKKEAQNMLTDSWKKETDKGLLGFEIKDAHFNLEVKYSTIERTLTGVPLQVESHNYDTEFKFQIEKFNLKADIEGLKSDNPHDVYASFVGDASIKTSLKILKDDKSMENASAEENGSFGIYMDYQYIYVDFADFHFFSSTFSKMFGESSLPSTKYKIANHLFDFLPSPIIQWDKQYDLGLNSTVEEEVNGGEYRDHGSETYSYSLHKTGEDFNQLQNDLTNGNSSANSINMKNDSYFDSAVIFSDEGIVSCGSAAKFEFDLTSEFFKSSDIHVKTDYSFKADFAHGKDVSAKEAEVHDYTLISQ